MEIKEANYVFLCDYASTDGLNGKINAMGIFNRIFIEKNAPFTYYSFSLIAKLTLPEEKEPDAIGIELIGPSTTVAKVELRKVTSNPDKAGVNIAVRFDLMKVSEPGTYNARFLLSFGKETEVNHTTKRLLEVVKKN